MAYPLLRSPIESFAGSIGDFASFIKQELAMDIGFPLAIILAGLIYYPLRRWELAKFKR